RRRRGLADRLLVSPLEALRRAVGDDAHRPRVAERTGAAHHLALRRRRLGDGAALEAAHAVRALEIVETVLGGVATIPDDALAARRSSRIQRTAAGVDGRLAARVSVADQPRTALIAVLAARSGRETASHSAEVVLADHAAALARLRALEAVELALIAAAHAHVADAAAAVLREVAAEAVGVAHRET